MMDCLLFIIFASLLFLLLYIITVLFFLPFTAQYSLLLTVF